jgi:hypothetical protein
MATPASVTNLPKAKRSAKSAGDKKGKRANKKSHMVDQVPCVKAVRLAGNPLKSGKGEEGFMPVF